MEALNDIVHGSVWSAIWRWRGRRHGPMVRLSPGPTPPTSARGFPRADFSTCPCPVILVAAVQGKGLDAGGKVNLGKMPWLIT